MVRNLTMLRWSAIVILIFILTACSAELPPATQKQPDPTQASNPILTPIEEELDEHPKTSGNCSPRRAQPGA